MRLNKINYFNVLNIHKQDTVLQPVRILKTQNGLFHFFGHNLVDSMELEAFNFWDYSLRRYRSLWLVSIDMQ
jgi:hypothetical protein